MGELQLEPQEYLDEGGVGKGSGVELYHLVAGGARGAHGPQRQR